jgi:hypothetical protein
VLAVALDYWDEPPRETIKEFIVFHEGSYPISQAYFHRLEARIAGILSNFYNVIETVSR